MEIHHSPEGQSEKVSSRAVKKLSSREVESRLFRRLAHIDYGPKAIRGSYIVPTHQPGLAFVIAITITFTRSTRAINRAVVGVAHCGGLAHIHNGPEAIRGAYIVPTHQPGLALVIAITIAFPRSTRATDCTIIIATQPPTNCRGYTHIHNGPEAIRSAHIVPTHQPGLALVIAITIAFPRSTRAINRAVVVVAHCRGLAHIHNGPKAIRGAYIVPTHQPGLALAIAITITFTRPTRAINRAVVVVARRRSRTSDDEANSCGVPQIWPLFRRVGHIGFIPKDNVLPVHIFEVPVRQLTPDAIPPTHVFAFMIAPSEYQVVGILVLRDNNSGHVPAIVIKKNIYTESGHRIAYLPAMIEGVSSRGIELFCVGLPACVGVPPNLIILVIVQVEV